MADDARSLVCIDLGTTNTRVWRVSGEGRILAKAQAQVGVRDTAREGSSELLCQTLQTLIRRVTDSAGRGDMLPTAVIAAGMITSSLGLLEIPHLRAPAALADLAAGTNAHRFPEVTEMPVWLVPGVRSGPGPMQNFAAMDQTDLMRGEETLCMGLLLLGIASGPAVVINLGSHWKAIQIDAAGRISGSVTSLAGEMIHAVQTTTILASAVPGERPDELDLDWLAEGMKQQRTAGLARAMFCVRLLEQANQSTPQQRWAYLVGAFIAADFDALMATKRINPQTRILLAGNKTLAHAWRAALGSSGVEGQVLSEEQVEQAMIAGLAGIFGAARRAE